MEKIDYRETTDDLARRIDIHNKYGSKDIDQWMLGLLPLRKGEKILDVGCGSGKQCFSYYDYLGGEADITGGDVNQELLAQAIENNKTRGADVKFVTLDFDKPFDFANDTFDLLSCCFAIYYATDIPFTISEMHRVLKPGGMLFTSGPMPDNKRFFYDVIRQATGMEIPPMPGSSRYSSLILNEMRGLFNKVTVHIFENSLHFDSVEPFVEYTRASLSEDRRLWKSFFETKDDFVKIMGKIEAVAKVHFDRDGELIMKKVVGGFLARK